MERLEQFEKMPAYVRENHAETIRQMDELRKENRQKSATSRQLTAGKMKYEDMPALFDLSGLEQEMCTDDSHFDD
ncbi:MAG: hypothetical protein ACI32N_02350 [Bulleidia sp.]